MEYELLKMDEVLPKLRLAHLRLQAGDPVEWDGPNKLHNSISAVSPPPSWHLSKEGLEYHGEQGRDEIEALLLVAFQLGVHNGVIYQTEFTDFYKKAVEMYANIAVKGSKNV